MTTLPIALSLAALSALHCGCADSNDRALVDVDGPRGVAVRPGPWTVTAVTNGATPQLFVGVGDGGVEAIPMAQPDGGAYRAELADEADGVHVRYFVEAGGERLPAEGSYRFVAVDPESDAGVDPARCFVRFLAPEAGTELTLADDSRPQAGLQIVPQVGTNAPDGAVARLTVNETGYAGPAVGGLFAFGPVTLPEGAVTLTADVKTEAGAHCTQTIQIQVF